MIRLTDIIKEANLLAPPLEIGGMRIGDEVHIDDVQYRITATIPHRSPKPEYVRLEPVQSDSIPIHLTVSDFLDKIKKGETLKEANKKEYIIWGIPPGERDEDVLYTKADSPAEAKRVMDILKNEHGCTKLRVQVLDLSKELDLKKTFGGTVNKS